VKRSRADRCGNECSKQENGKRLSKFVKFKERVCCRDAEKQRKKTNDFGYPC
jgi:hypothetical protein